jgi:hypothetical protein
MVIYSIIIITTITSFVPPVVVDERMPIIMLREVSGVTHKSSKRVSPTKHSSSTEELSFYLSEEILYTSIMIWIPFIIILMILWRTSSIASRTAVALEVPVILKWII